MIDILLTRRNGCFIKLSVCGHSMYDISGRDIVCAAVSVMVQSLIIGLEQVVSSDFDYLIDEKKARVNVDISRYDINSMDKAQVLFRTFRLTMDGLLLDYKQYINMKVKEE